MVFERLGDNFRTSERQTNAKNTLELRAAGQQMSSFVQNRPGRVVDSRTTPIYPRHSRTRSRHYAQSVVFPAP